MTVACHWPSQSLLLLGCHFEPVYDRLLGLSIAAAAATSLAGTLPFKNVYRLIRSAGLAVRIIAE